LDYVAALSQAPFERDLYMKIPNRIHLQGKASADQVLKLLTNLLVKIMPVKYGTTSSGSTVTTNLMVPVTSLNLN
jgi:hypothetical protein